MNIMNSSQIIIRDNILYPFFKEKEKEPKVCSFGNTAKFTDNEWHVIYQGNCRQNASFRLFKCMGCIIYR